MLGRKRLLVRLLRSEVHERCRPLVVGHPGILQRAIDLLHVHARVQIVDANRLAADCDNMESAPETIFCLAVGSDDVLSAPVATIDARGGQAAYDALVTAARLALARQVDGIVTAPLHKAGAVACGASLSGAYRVAGRALRGE